MKNCRCGSSEVELVQKEVVRNNDTKLSVYYYKCRKCHYPETYERDGVIVWNGTYPMFEDLVEAEARWDTYR